MLFLSAPNDTSGGSFSIAIGFWAFFLCFVIQFFLGYRILKKLWERDTLERSHVCPRPYGLISRFLFILLMLVMLIVATVIDKDSGMQLMSAIGLSVGVFIYYDTFSLKVAFADGILVYKKHNKTRQISKEDIVNIKWEQKPRTLGRVLVIYLRSGGAIELKQTDFVGLRALARSIGGE